MVTFSPGLRWSRAVSTRRASWSATRGDGSPMQRLGTEGSSGFALRVGVRLELRNSEPRPSEHRNGGCITRVRVAGNTETGVVVQYPADPAVRVRGPVRDHDQSGMDRVPDPDATPVMDRYPRGSARDVEESNEDRPVCDRVGPVEHRLGLPEGARDASAVVMVAADGDRRAQLRVVHHLVDPVAEPLPFAVSHVADPRGESLERYAFGSEPDPAAQVFVGGELREDHPVDSVDVLGLAA